MANVKKNNVNFVYDKNKNKVVARKNVQNKKNTTKKKIILEDNTNVKNNQKERNKQKYYARQKKYQHTTNKKVIINPEIENTVVVKKKEINKEKKVDSKMNKKVIVNPELEKTTNIVEMVQEYASAKIAKKEEEKQSKESHQKRTWILFKKHKKQVINPEIEDNQKEEMPLGDDKENNNKRVKIYLKEAFVYAILITIVNIVAYFVFDYVHYLKLFDLKWVNMVISIVLSLIISYVFSFFIDSLVSEVWIKIKSMHKEGEHDGNSWFKRRKNRRNIQN